MALKQYPLFIGGQWVDGNGRGQFDVLNPATSEPIAAVPDQADGLVVRGDAGISPAVGLDEVPVGRSPHIVV